VKSTLSAALAQAGLHTEMQTWDQLASFYHRVVELYNGIFLFVIIVIAVVVLFGITNTMMIAVMERTAEIGTLRAIGTRQSGIVKQFVVEGLVLAAVSSVVGVLIGVAMSRGITGLDIMMPPPPGSSRGYPLRIALVPWVWMVSACGVWMIAAFATLFPAINASRKSIVDALRHV
jgi:putative ABC transport system permease protein